jgi:opacity protein-like surface antigen
LRAEPGRAARAKRMKERRMRWVFCLLTVFGMASPALAADYDLPILRGTAVPAPVMTVGPATFTRWSGFYFGGDFSYGSATSDFSDATRPLVAFSLRGLTLEDQAHPSRLQVLGRGADNAPGVGGFLGYNTQWQDLIIGVEATYTHTNLNTRASSSPLGFGQSPGRVFPTLGDSVAINANGNLDLTDYASVRGRAGYVVGNLLPYGFAGFVLGRASYSVASSVVVQQNTAPSATFPCVDNGTTCQTFLFSNAVGQNNALMYGFSVGGGLDWAVTQNVFLRGEFEFVQFAPISNISVALISGRVGGGFKF